jgi:Putative zinc-finger
MDTPTPKEVQCDDALRLLSRSLDGDLTRAETRQLYLHLASCESCRARMGQMAALASDLEELNRQYAGQSLGATFAEKVREAVRHVEPEQPAQAPPSRMVYQPTRFHLYEVQLYSAHDNVNWTHTQLLPPRDTLRLVVHREDERSYHFRLESWGPAPVAVTFEDAHVGKSSVEHLILQGIRYAFLQIPQLKDAVVIQNEGEQPIYVSASVRQPDALMVWILRHNSWRPPSGPSHTAARPGPEGEERGPTQGQES